MVEGRATRIAGQASVLIGTVAELIVLLWVHKLWWVIPMLLLLLLIAALVFLGQTTTVAPFIYPIF